MDAIEATGKEVTERLIPPLLRGSGQDRHRNGRPDGKPDFDRFADVAGPG